MVNQDEIKNQIEEILNVYIPIDKRGELLTIALLKLIDSEKSKSYNDGYNLRTSKE